MEGCIFCKIVNKEIKSEIVYEDNKFVVFRDINPQAPIHLLVVPKQHLENISTITEENEAWLQGIFSVIKNVAEKLGILKEGYRVVVNNGKNAGQEVNHLHFHVLAGRKFSWPPG
ncbi:MAG: histidine triad nucleotide-binding protein [Candidatus Anstonellales archaeon]